MASREAERMGRKRSPSRHSEDRNDERKKRKDKHKKYMKDKKEKEEQRSVISGHKIKLKVKKSKKDKEVTSSKPGCRQNSPMKFVDDKAKQICRDRLRFYGSFSRGPIVMTTKEMWQHQPKLFKTSKEAMKLETNGKHARTSEKWTDRAVGAPRQRGRGAAMCSRQHSRALLHGPPSSFRLSSSGSSESDSETESTEESSAKRLRLSRQEQGRVVELPELPVRQRIWGYTTVGYR
ncbi:hypothetical protein Bbelb_423520 [Branchiostoma belcheri]|nr:hypothetical protein Bbelb_423520 [Branchiostoma belcheri]